MYRAYIKNLDDLELDFTEIPHEGHFVYGNLIKGGTYSDTDAIVGDLIEVTDEYVNPEWWCSIEKGSAEQYSGLKDSNGNKIYVGDIILLTPTIPLYKVSFDNGEYRAIAKHEITYSLNDINNDCKVVGNVHENLELLED